MAEEKEKLILDGLVSEGDSVLLIIPINKAYPKGRLKPLQVAIMREALERHVNLIVIQPEELVATLHNLKMPPKLVITDSQVFKNVFDKIPKESFFTSFSILFANYKGTLDTSIEGLNFIDKLSDGDSVAIIEACTHHRQEGDISRELLPEMLAKKTGKRLKFKFLNGLMPSWDDLSDVRLILHCGGCMITERDMRSRLEKFQSMGIPTINYGVFISNFYEID
ncbi:MAG: [FeFe] hydrogenase H-cluster maturation GTPase HydF, partial [Proteobacteria bacterium]|nr:[FeFe] hydrogenase H-cluster maturation GTPase HydF [Pseudomonadota bacterium]